MKKDAARALIYSAIDELNEGFSKKGQVEKSPDATLFGPSGLSSLNTINLLVILDEKLKSGGYLELSVVEALTNDEEGALPETVDAFADWLTGLLGGPTHE